MTETVDYQKRLKELKEPGELDKTDWFNPQPGQYTIKFLSEGIPYQTEYDGETINKIRFKIEESGKEYLWGISEGKTKASLYGQVLVIASQEPKNKVTDKEVSLLVKSDGKKRDYTILEAITSFSHSSKIEEVEIK